jgi:putative tryptophan/tyrosine transport system substrate-binding protein
VQFDQLNRRDILTLFGAAAAAWPAAAWSQQRTALPRVGILLYSSPRDDPQMAAFGGGLRDLGYIEGQNIILDYRYAEGRAEKLPALAAVLVRLQPDVIIAVGGDVAPSAKQATQTIPIVFAISADPEKLGLVASLSRPGGNATGVTFLQDELASKRMQLLKDAAPRISRVALLWNPDHPDNELRDAQRAGQNLGIDLYPIEVRGSDDFDAAFQAATRARSDALYVVSSRHTVLNIPRIVDFAAKNRLPLVGGWGAWAKAGGLLSYGPNVGVMVRRAATHVDRILKGAKLSDLPVEQPTKFELIVNQKTAKTLNLTIAESFLLQADEVIE